MIDTPLLVERLPIRFAEIRAADVEPAIELLLKQMKQRLADIGSSGAPRTYDNVLIALDTLTEPLDFAVALVRHLEAVVTTPELRAAHNAIQGPVSMFYTSIPLDADLWAAVKAVKDSSEAQLLGPVHKRFLHKTVTGFRRAGANLDAEGKKRLEQLDVELTKTTTKFSENVLDATNAFELIVNDEKQLAGLPESARSAARESAKAKGKEGWRFTLQAPSYVPALTYLDDRAIRRDLWTASNERAMGGQYDNRALISEILKLRCEKARLLGYKDFADLVLEDRMAHTGTEAQSFLDNLYGKTQRFFDAENRSLEELAKSMGTDEVQPWDVAYLAEKQRQLLYEFDEEELRPYFQLDSVVSGMFDIFSRVLAIRVVEEPTVPGWDPAVKYFRVEDESSGELLGGFYTDWFPRENKRGGAWMDALVMGDPDKRKPHIGLICGNLMPPVGDTPSLLVLREVETIFHEFGHLLHHILSRVPIRTLAGTNVPWDFVELPSQILENWCMEYDALSLFARHYQTGELLPEALFQKMKRARTFRAANAQMRQLSFGILDLKLHREYDPIKDGDVMKYSRDLLAQFSSVPLPAEYGLIATFTHLFASPVAYGAGYYSYKWAEVLDADAFTRFKRDGIFNQNTGRDFRHHILERGDSEDPAELYRGFMRRDPNPDALLERLGLLQTT